jgi:hypothetical protein
VVVDVVELDVEDVLVELVLDVDVLLVDEEDVEEVVDVVVEGTYIAEPPREQFAALA